MSRAWMPMYWGDYLRDTRNLTTLQHGAYLLLIAHYWQHGALPTDENELATIVGLTVGKWQAIRGPVAAKFLDGWRHKRVEDEIAKCDRKILQRSMAGQKGGTKSGMGRTIRAAEERKNRVEARTKQTLAPRLSENETCLEAADKHSRTNHKVSIKPSSFPTAASEVGEISKEVVRRACADVSRQELEAMFEARRTQGKDYVK